MSHPDWHSRAERAERLAGTHPSSAQALRFYAGLLRVQRSISEESHFPLLLYYVEGAGTGELSRRASELRAAGPHRWSSLFESYRLEHELEPWEVFFARAYLQPAIEHSGTECPYCGRAPQASVLRPAFDGTKRSLVCSMCSSEWDIRRILCPRCGEEGFDELPVYSFEQFDYIRVEACESCKGCLLSVDLSRCPEAIPMVDELAALPVSLWAIEQGYEKIQPNLLGI